MIDEWYSSFTQTALRMNEGNLTEAEKMMDCNVYMWYWRMVQKNNYIEWHNERLKPKE